MSLKLINPGFAKASALLTLIFDSFRIKDFIAIPLDLSKAFQHIREF
jgi:hypothetical protein